MKAKVMSLALVLGLSFCFVGCNSTGEGTENNNVENNTENISAEVLTQEQVRIDETLITIGDAMEEVKAVLGEPIEYNESKSCYYEGYDKTYTYEEIIIITYPMDGGEYIGSITMLSNNVENGCGIVIGDTVEDIKGKYVEEDLTITPTCYMYEKGDFGIAFYLDGETVTEIELYFIAE